MVGFFLFFFLGLLGGTSQSERKSLGKKDPLGTYQQDPLCPPDDKMREDLGAQINKIPSRMDPELLHRWLNKRGVPLLEIDPSLIDTSQYDGWYTYSSQVPLANSQGQPIVIGDIDGNSMPEAYGVFKDFGRIDTFRARIYELDSLGAWNLRYTYEPYAGGPYFFVDSDGDGLAEIIWRYADTLRAFEQNGISSLPTQLHFAYQDLEAGDPGATPSIVGFMDGDLFPDLLAKTTWRDSTDTLLVHRGTSIAEFDQSLDNFHRVWERDPYQQDSILVDHGGYAAGDFDNDGSFDFAQSFTEGIVQVFENTGDNDYQLTWQDTTVFTNLVYGTSGDVDHDGTMEFFRGATMYDGNWTIVFESTGDNLYTPTFLFHLLGSGTFTEPTYLTSDLDGDAIPELMILSGSHLFVFKSDGDNSYYLWYYKLVPNPASVTAYNFGSGVFKSLVLSRWIPDSLFTSLRFESDIYAPGPALSVDPFVDIPSEPQLLQNYPNPFNPVTTITYRLKKSQRVMLRVYNTIGEMVATLVEENQPAGSRQIKWDAHGFPSGVYFYRLQVSNLILARKMVLVR